MMKMAVCTGKSRTNPSPSGRFAWTGDNSDFDASTHLGTARAGRGVLVPAEARRVQALDELSFLLALHIRDDPIVRGGGHHEEPYPRGGQGLDLIRGILRCSGEVLLGQRSHQHRLDVLSSDQN